MLSLNNISFAYPGGGFSLHLESLEIPQGRSLALKAPSGGGKTTLLNLAAGILSPDEGKVRFEELFLGALSEKERRRFRLEKLGFVFQDFELLEYLTVYDNIRLNYLLGLRYKETKVLDEEIRRLADQAGIASRLNRHPRSLSKGEQQRTALCRALLSRPRLILADEATSNLDEKSKRNIWDMIFAYMEESGASLLAATHDAALLPRFDEVADLEQIMTIKAEVLQ